MNGWSPNPNDLRTILELLHSSQSADNEVQRQVQERLQQLNQYPDFHYYLGFNHSKIRSTNKKIFLSYYIIRKLAWIWTTIGLDAISCRAYSQKQYQTILFVFTYTRYYIFNRLTDKITDILVMQERLAFIRAEVIKTISDSSSLIRATGSIVITTIASRIGLVHFYAHFINL